ncbi:hypothetical protein Focb16_v016439 [Fusarium oxysporum f. sp. cubense]|uniref:Peptidase metallopeptidase domain-containing protein n=1 Tax=Fusarium oxysporum f. sp. cubense TaxID=61366 RepID=A0A559KZ43_FUSOC|nr:hypothetical protein Focb16_v016439 [Fusarium oxysporum f. sp. cubense]
MHTTFLFFTAALLASLVKAGSPVWEISTASHNILDNDLVKRAVSINPQHDYRDSSRTRLWPDKKITYAFADDEAKEKLEGQFRRAVNIWGTLSANGFKYEAVTPRKCRSHRSECLLIHYNDQGTFRSSIGIPAVNRRQGAEGPTMHLSDKIEVGNLDTAINTAHEIGHVWGLGHEHQVKEWWGQSDSDEKWIEYLTGEDLMTEDYHCENLQDYEAAKAKLEEANASKEDKDKDTLEGLCRIGSIAKKYGFSAMDWVPLPGLGFQHDDKFDEASLMLYPSGAGGKGRVNLNAEDPKDRDQRLPILTFPGGERIPLRECPSSGDIGKLLEIYGTDYVGTSKLLNDKDSKFRGLFNKIRGKSSKRAGDTEAGIC